MKAKDGRDANDGKNKIDHCFHRKCIEQRSIFVEFSPIERYREIVRQHISSGVHSSSALVHRNSNNLQTSCSRSEYHTEDCGGHYKNNATGRLLIGSQNFIPR